MFVNEYVLFFLSVNILPVGRPLFCQTDGSSPREEILNGNNFKMKIKMGSVFFGGCSVLIVTVLNGLENKRTFQAAAFKTWPLQLRKKNP